MEVFVELLQPPWEPCNRGLTLSGGATNQRTIRKLIGSG